MKRHSELLLSIYQVGYHFVEMAPILELRRLVKDYLAHRAVDQISLSVPRGGFYSLLGPSGCGKTTTLRLIAGFEEPSSGDVLLDGVVVTTRKPYPVSYTHLTLPTILRV